MELSEYLALLSAQIRSRKARTFVQEEISAHIEDQTEAFQEMGMEPPEALAESIRQMGDPVKVGMEMDRIHRPRTDWKTLIIIILFSLAGLAVQYHMSADANYNQFFRQCIYTGLGLLLMIGVYFIDYTLIGKYTFLLWGFCTVSLSVAPVFVRPVNGGYIYIQIILYLLAPCFAGIVYRSRGQGKKGFAVCCICGGISLLPVFFIYHSINMFVCLYTIFLLIMTAAAAKGWFISRKILLICSMWGLSLAGIVLFLILGPTLGLLQPYQIARLQALGNPLFEPHGSTYIQASIFSLKDSWALWGSASSNLPLEQMLPGYSYDYIITYLFTYLGIGGTCLLLLAFGLLFMRIFYICFRQPNQLGMIVGLSCGLVLSLETVRYVLSNLGYILFSQLCMPFFSYGLRSTLITFFMLGILLSIYRYKDIASEPKPKKISMKVSL